MRTLCDLGVGVAKLYFLALSQSVMFMLSPNPQYF